MLITKEVEVKLHNKIIKHYENLEYDIPKKLDKRNRIVVDTDIKIIVKVNDLTNSSIVPVQCLCDYCLEEGIETIVNKTWRDYRKSREFIQKDCCEKCTPKKYKESCLKKYNVENTFQLDEIKNKIIITSLEKYGETSFAKTKEYDKKARETRLKRHGVEYSIHDPISLEKMHNTMLDKYGKKYYAQTEECKEKIKITNLNRYGKEYISQVDEFKNKIENTMLDRYGVKRYVQSEDFKLKFSKENSPKWKGGISTIQEYLRKRIENWKIDSLAFNNYKCNLTGRKDNLIIHHVYSFSNIVFETLNELKIDIYDSINKYTEEQLKLIVNKCLELHYKYGFGVCLTKNIHDLFHKLYRKGSNTPEQFEEFTQRYYKGEFNNLLFAI